MRFGAPRSRPELLPFRCALPTTPNIHGDARAETSHSRSKAAPCRPERFCGPLLSEARRPFARGTRLKGCSIGCSGGGTSNPQPTD
jgi:hypothetical protein